MSARRAPRGSPAPASMFRLATCSWISPGNRSGPLHSNFSGEDNQITSRSGFVPMFTNDTTVTSATLAVPPVIVSQPPHRTVDAGSDVTFPHHRRRNRTARLPMVAQRDEHSQGATNTALSLAHVLGDDTAEYTLVVTNTLAALPVRP